MKLAYLLGLLHREPLYGRFHRLFCSSLHSIFRHVDFLTLGRVPASRQQTILPSLTSMRYLFENLTLPAARRSSSYSYSKVWRCPAGLTSSICCSSKEKICVKNR